MKSISGPTIRALLWPTWRNPEYTACSATSTLPRDPRWEAPLQTFGILPRGRRLYPTHNPSVRIDASGLSRRRRLGPRPRLGVRPPAHLSIALPRSRWICAKSLPDMEAHSRIAAGDRTLEKTCAPRVPSSRTTESPKSAETQGARWTNRCCLETAEHHGYTILSTRALQAERPSGENGRPKRAVRTSDLPGAR